MCGDGTYDPELLYSETEQQVTAAEVGREECAVSMCEIK